MLAAPGQPVNIHTQGLYGWERVGRSMGAGLGEALSGTWQLSGLEQVNRAGELAEFSEQLKGIRDEVRDELKEREVKDWDYSWNAAMAPRLREAVQGLSADSRESAMELARSYSAQASIEARRDRELERVSTARGRWEQQVESAIAAGQEEQAARWLESGRGIFVPQGQMPQRLAEVRSRACRSRLEARLQAAPMEALAEMAAAEGAEGSSLPLRAEESRRLEESCTRMRHSLRRELARRFSDALRAGEELEPATLSLAARAGILPAAPPLPEAAADTPPDAATRSAWRRWVDDREDGEEGELAARLSLATAPLPLAERAALLARLERLAQVPAADRRALNNRLFLLYNSGALGCPGDAEAQRALLALQEEGATLLAEQGAAAVADWVDARRSTANNWVCFENNE